MPLYVPQPHIHLTFGHRLRDRGGDRWSTNEPGFEAVLEAAVQKEVPFLTGLNTALNVANALKPFVLTHMAKKPSLMLSPWLARFELLWMQ